MPTLGEFVDRVRKKYDGQVVPLSGELRLPFGPATPIRRLMCPGFRFTILPEFGDDERLMPSKVRSMCGELGIPVTEFGLVDDAAN